MTDRAITLEEIEAALHAGELCFYFQPKISFQTGRIVGGEALLRWKKDDGTLIAPGAFLPLAEPVASHERKIRRMSVRYPILVKDGAIQSGGDSEESP